MKVPKAIHLFSAICAIVLVASLISIAYLPSQEERVSHSLSNGATIIAALEAYRLETNIYPDNLERLVPKHLKTIPQPIWGTHKWFYHPLSRDAYELIVLRHGNYYEGYYHNTKNKKWNYHS